MAICPRRKLCFIHIPKTGGSTIESLMQLRGDGHRNAFGEWPLQALHLRRAEGSDDSAAPFPRVPDPRTLLSMQHFSLTELVYFNFLKEEQLSSYFKFCFVRNPWDRLASSYASFYHEVTTDFQNYIEIVESAVRQVETTNRPFIQHEVTFPIAGNAGPPQINTHFLPQYRFITHLGHQNMDFVGRFEDYEKDLLLLCHKLSARDPTGTPLISAAADGMTSIPHENPSAHRYPHYREYYSEYSRRIIARIYAADIAMFNYRF